MFKKSGIKISKPAPAQYPQKGEVCFVWDENSGKSPVIRVHINDGIFITEGEISSPEGTVTWDYWESLGVVVDIQE